MPIGVRLGMFVPLLLLSAAGFAQQSVPVTPPAITDAGSHEVSLDVVVTPKGGAPVAGLTQQDFTVLDNKAPQTITSFQAYGGKEEPVEVVLVVDGVNTTYTSIAYERGEIDKFLRSNGGQLAYPMSLAFVTDKGAQIQNGSSKDGNALSDSLDHYDVGLREITRSTGFYGADERLQISLRSLRMLAEHEATQPGRKIVLWMSPGWPLLSGPRVIVSAKQQQSVFNAIIDVSTELRQGRITLYAVDPLGTADAASGRTFYYQNFLKGVRKSTDVDFGDLGLEVIATQTGGLVLNSSNDIAALLQKCMADVSPYYELSFNPTRGEPNEYHSVEVKVAKAGLVARTRTGYYSQP